MTVIDTYTLQIVRDDETVPKAWSGGTLEAVMAETMENLTLLLPDGYRAVIRRWDEGDEDE